MYMRVCSKCGRKYPADSSCPCGGFRRVKKTDKFYKTTSWDKVREVVLNECNNIDLYHLYCTGRIVPAVHIHHIIPLREDRDKGLNLDNLFALSKESHEEIEALYNKGEKEKRETQILLRNIKKKYKEFNQK